MTGWQQPIGNWLEPENVFCLVVDKRFPEPELHSLLEGVKFVSPDALWVCRATDHRAKAALAIHFPDRYLTAPLLKHWTWFGYDPDEQVMKQIDRRALWRDRELAQTVERIFVAHAAGSKATDWWRSLRNARVAERAAEVRPDV